MIKSEINLLLVEDNQGDARLIIEMLKESRQISYIITVSESITSAIGKLEENNYDAIIVDLNLPDSSGLKTLDDVITNTYNLIPVIVMTGINDDETGISAIEHGAEDFIVKGEVNSSQLIRSIRYAIERQKNNQEMQSLLADVQEEKNRLSALINNITDEIWFADINGKFTIANPIALKRFCIDSSKMIEVDKLAESLIVLRPDGSVRPIEEAPPLRALAGEVVSNQEEIVRIPETNEFRNRQVNATPVRGSNGEIIGSVSVVRDITDLKTSVKAIEKAAREWRTTFDSISDAIWLIDPEFRIIRANAASERFLGMTPAELIGKNCWDVVHGTGMPIDGCPAARAKKTLKPETTLVKLKKLWVNITVYPIFADGGELTGIVHIIHDVTKEKKADDELLLRNSAMENAANAILITDTEGTIVWINSAFEKLTQFTPAEVIGTKPGAVLKSGRHSTEFYEELWSTIKSGQTWKGEIINKKKDGTIYTEEMTIAPVKNASGEIRNYIAIKQDITDKKIAGDLLNTRLELVDYSDSHTLEEILIKTLDEVERFTLSTISFFHFLEEDQNTLSLQAWSTETSNKFCKAAGKGTHYNVEDAGVWVDCIRGNGPVVHNDYMSLPHRKGLPEGHAPVIREMVIPIIRDHKIKAILGVGNKLINYTERDISVTTYFADIAWDIIERKRTLDYLKQFNNELEVRVAERTAQLEKANKELDSFSYSVSHDLRSPLRHITGFIEMFRIEAGDMLDGKAKHYMEVIDESAKRMGQLIDDLLSFSRMGRASLSSNLVNMNDLVNDVLKDFSDEILGAEINIVMNHLSDIKGDRAMLRVVYVNLISNSVKFSKKSVNPEIIIGHEIINGEDTFFVRDNGVGFNMQYAPKLFGVFQRLHNERDFSGTGIGLAMVKNIIERHNGRIWAEGEPDKGACFYFVLPESKTGSPANNKVSGK